MNHAAATAENEKEEEGQGPQEKQTCFGEVRGGFGLIRRGKCRRFLLRPIHRGRSLLRFREEEEDDDTEERYLEESESYPDSETDSDEAIERVLKVPSDKILRPFLFYGIQAPIKIVLSALLSQHRWHVLVRHRLGGALSVLRHPSGAHLRALPAL